MGQFFWPNSVFVFFTVIFVMRQTREQSVDRQRFVQTLPVTGEQA